MSAEKVMPFWDHIIEIRNRLLVVIVCILFCSVAGYLLFPVFYDTIRNILQEELYATNITEGFAMRIKIAFLCGVMLSLPVLVFEIVLFLLPALRKKEKITLIVLLFFSLLLFIGGILFAYRTILPVSIVFLKTKEFFPDNLNRIISYEMFVMFVFQFLIGFGICFQFPIVLIFLMKLNILKVKTLVKSFKYVFILILIVAAVLTPSVDILSQIMLAFPMVVLYWISILIAKIFRLGA